MCILIYGTYTHWYTSIMYEPQSMCIYTKKLKYMYHTLNASELWRK
jgi:hypothetical protein